MINEPIVAQSRIQVWSRIAPFGVWVTGAKGIITASLPCMCQWHSPQGEGWRAVGAGQSFERQKKSGVGFLCVAPPPTVGVMPKHFRVWVMPKIPRVGVMPKAGLVWMHPNPTACLLHNLNPTLTLTPSRVSLQHTRCERFFRQFFAMPKVTLTIFLRQTTKILLSPGQWGEFLS